jgi:hypothetical protein
VKRLVYVAAALAWAVVTFAQTTQPGWSKLEEETKGMRCYSVGPALDVEDGPRGFDAHRDQERLLKSELFRFVRLHWDIVADLARAR